MRPFRQPLQQIRGCAGCPSQPSPADEHLHRNGETPDVTTDSAPDSTVSTSWIPLPDGRQIDAGSQTRSVALMDGHGDLGSSAQRISWSLLDIDAQTLPTQSLADDPIRQLVYRFDQHPYPVSDASIQLRRLDIVTQLARLFHPLLTYIE